MSRLVGPLRLALVLGALWLGMVGMAGRVTGPLPLEPEVIRTIRSLGFTGLDVRRVINALVILVAASHLVPAVYLLLARGADRTTARGAGIALLILGAAALAAGIVPIAPLWIVVALAAAAQLILLARGTAGEAGMRRAIGVGVVVAALVALAATWLPVLHPRREGLDALLAAPALLVAWLPLPWVLAGSLARGGLWRVARPRYSPALMRGLATGAVAGAVAGAIALGVGSRLAMRAVALLAGIPPMFTVDGTLFLVIMGTVFGVAMAGLGVLVGGGATAGRRSGHRVWGVGMGFAGLLAVLIAAAPTDGELGLVGRPMGIALFAPLPLYFALIQIPLHRALDRWWPEGGLARVGSVALGGAGLVAVVLLVVPFWEGATELARALR